MFPTARTLREADIYAHYLGYMGGFGVQFGVNGDLDLGVGLVPYPLSLTVSGKWAFLQDEDMAFGLFVEFQVPVVKNPFWSDDVALDYMLLLATGPVFSLYGAKYELDVGFLFVPVMQWHRGGEFDVDYALFPYVLGSIKLGGSVKMLLGAVHNAVVGLEDWRRRVPVVPDPEPHEVLQRCEWEDGPFDNPAVNVPALMLGFRFHSRNFAADVGIAAPLHPDWWAYTDWVLVPFATFSHLW
jgi:hypothetical protein